MSQNYPPYPAFKQQGCEPATVDAATVDRVNLVSMFNKLDAYGQRVLLAQAAAMLRVQAGA